MDSFLEQFFQIKRPFSIRSARFPPRLRILVVGPHPDDFDAIGVTMRFFQDHGHRIHVAVMRTGSGVEDSYCTSPTWEKKATLREAEQRRSVQFFGLEEGSLTFLDMEQDEKSHPTLAPANLDTLRDVLFRVHPDFVFCPHGNDTNASHRAVYAMIRRVGGQAPWPMMVFLNRDPKTLTMRFDCYLAFGEEPARWKSRLLRFHDSQHQRNLNTRHHGFDERILSVNRDTARQLGIAEPYAEVFELERLGLPTCRSDPASCSGA